MARTEQFHITAVFYLPSLPSIFSCFFSSLFAQAAKQAIEAGFIFNPNSLRLPFNAWVSVGQALWNVHRTNIVEANYAL